MNNYLKAKEKNFFRMNVEGKWERENLVCSRNVICGKYTRVLREINIGGVYNEQH